MVHKVSFHSMLADKDSPLVISAVAWVLLGGKATKGYQEGRPRTIHPPALWEKDTPKYHPAALLLWPQGLSWLLVFPILIPPRPGKPRIPGKSLSIRNLFSSLQELIPSAHRAASTLQTLAPPSSLFTHFSDQEIIVLRLTGKALVLRLPNPWQCQGPSAPRHPGPVLWSTNPNLLQQCLQQLGDIGRIMEDDHWPEQKLGYV